MNAASGRKLTALPNRSGATARAELFKSDETTPAPCNGHQRPVTGVSAALSALSAERRSRLSTDRRDLRGLTGLLGVSEITGARAAPSIGGAD